RRRPRAAGVGRDLAGEPCRAGAPFSGGAVAPRRRRDSRSPSGHRQIAPLIRPVRASKAPQPRKEHVMSANTEDTLRQHLDAVDRYERKYKRTWIGAGIVCMSL